MTPSQRENYPSWVIEHQIKCPTIQSQNRNWLQSLPSPQFDMYLYKQCTLFKYFEKSLLGRWKAASGDGGMETVSLAGSEDRLPNLGSSPINGASVADDFPLRILTDLAPVPGLAPVQCLWSCQQAERMRWKHGNFMFPCHCFLDTKRCQSTNHIVPSRPYQKVHLALAAFLH